MRTTWNHDGHPTKAITKAVEAELGAASNWKVRGEGKNPLTAGRGKAIQVRSMCPSQPTQLPPSLKQKKQTQHPPPNQQGTRWQRRHEWPCHAAGPTPALCSTTMPLTVTGASFRNIVGLNSRSVVVVYSHVVYIILITDYIFNTIFISSFEGLPTGIRAEYGTWQIFGIITFRRQWPCNNGLIIPLMNTTILLFATQSQSYVINPTLCLLFVGPIYNPTTTILVITQNSRCALGHKNDSLKGRVVINYVRYLPFINIRK